MNESPNGDIVSLSTNADIGLVPMDPVDVRAIVRAIPEWVRELMHDNEKISVSGGFPRAIIAGETPKDIDVWTPKALDILDVCVIPRVGEAWPSLLETNAYTIREGEPVPVSFVYCHRFETLEECLDRFDFTVCQAGVCVRNGEWFGLVGESFYRDLAARRLVVREAGLDSPVSTCERIVRYASRGYRINRGQFKPLAKIINGMSADELEVSFYDY